MKKLYKLPSGTYVSDLEEYFNKLEQSTGIRFIDRSHSPFSGVRLSNGNRYTYRYNTATNEEKSIVIDEINS